MIFAVGVGIPLGYFAARRHGSWLDHLSVAGSLLGITIPVFFLGYMLKYVFAEKLGWPDRRPAGPALDAVIRPGSTCWTAWSPGIRSGFADAFMHLILPGIALGTIPLAIIVRITRASVLDVLHEDYVRTAEAKGLKSGRSAAGTCCATRCCRSSPSSGCQPACCSAARCSPRPSSPSPGSASSSSTRSAQGLPGAAGLHPVHRDRVRPGEPAGRHRRTGSSTRG